MVIFSYLFCTPHITTVTVTQPVPVSSSSSSSSTSSSAPSSWSAYPFMNLLFFIFHLNWITSPLFCCCVCAPNSKGDINVTWMGDRNSILLLWFIRFIIIKFSNSGWNLYDLSLYFCGSSKTPVVSFPWRPRANFSFIFVFNLSLVVGGGPNLKHN